MSDPLSSRSGLSHPLGKLDDELKMKIPSALGDRLRQAANDAGMSASEMAREILIRGLFGKRMYSELHARRARSVDSLWEEKGGE